MPHRIEVDDEVMSYLKSRAEAFIDTPNSVLRRLLLEDREELPTAAAASRHQMEGIVPSVPAGTPKALEQILQVAYLTLNSTRTRAEATHAVARHHGIAFQTVLDKYSRQLDLRTDEFDELLTGPNLERLRRMLKRKFDRHKDVIESTLEGGTDS